MDWGKIVGWLVTGFLLLALFVGIQAFAEGVRLGGIGLGGIRSDPVAHGMPVAAARFGLNAVSSFMGDYADLEDSFSAFTRFMLGIASALAFWRLWRLFQSS